VKRLFFARGADFRRWLEKNHQTAAELRVGFWKVDSGEPSMSWSESVDEALCFGWIDGIRRSIDAHSYEIRFTPRKPKSIWSRINLDKVDALTKAGRMAAAGLRAWEARDEVRSKIYSYEQVRAATLDAEAARALKADAAAWKFFQTLPPSYRSQVAYWLAQAKKPETRARRLAEAVQSFSRGERLAQHRYGERKKTR
jgi:uncharacterized protein YdeI (YjbR/CyaY-like superfamily)